MRSAAATPPGHTGFSYGYIIVIAGLLISIAMWGSRQSFAVFFGPLLDEFGWHRGPTSAAFSLTWIGTGILAIFVGRLNDRFGPRVIMTVAGCFVGLGCILISTLDSMWQLFLYYGVINIGMSASLIPIMSTVARWFVRQRALMSGIVLAGTGVALMVVVPISNLLVANYGWRMSYAIVGGATLVIMIISSQFLRRDPQQLGQRPRGHDAAGTPHAGAPVSGLTATQALRTGQLPLLAAVYFCTYFLFYVIIAHAVLYATGNNVPLAQAVTVLSVVGVTGIAGRVLMGMLADRSGYQRTMVSSGVLVLAAFALLLISPSIWMMYAFAALFGFGHGGLGTMESPMTAHIFGMRSHGTILGMVFAVDTLGGALGPILAGFVFDEMQSYTLVIQLCVLVAAVNLVAILFLRPVQQPPQHPARRMRR
ncbi:MAG: MFS transporter [Burkholderiales bacterium]|nr:MFS transporter [Burkholderiales bacterium]